MSKHDQSPFDRFTKLHEAISNLLSKRRADGRSLDVSDFPSTDAEKKAWEIYTAPENFEIMSDLNLSAPPMNKQSLELWRKALGECQQKTLQKIIRQQRRDPQMKKSLDLALRHLGVYRQLVAGHSNALDDLELLVQKFEALRKLGPEYSKIKLSSYMESLLSVTRRGVSEDAPNLELATSV